MRESVPSLEQIALWTLFFFTSVYGHVALKLAADQAEGGTMQKVWSGTISPWGLSAIVSWTLSGVLWMMVLSGTGLLRANSISSLRYVMVSLAAAWFLHETVTPKSVAGMALIAAGLLLIGRD